MFVHWVCSSRVGPFAHYANPTRFIGVVLKRAQIQNLVYKSPTVLLSHIITSFVPRLLVGREKECLVSTVCEFT